MRNIFSSVWVGGRVWVLSVAMAFWGVAFPAPAQQEGGNPGSSFLSQVGDVSGDIGRGAGEIEGNKVLGTVNDTVGNLSEALEKAIKEGATKDWGKLIDKADDIGKAAKVLKVLDLALKAIKIAGLKGEAEADYYAGDRAAFRESFNTLVLETLKTAGGMGASAGAGAATGFVLGSFFPGVGNLAGLAIGTVAGLAAGWFAEWGIEALYNEYFTDEVKKLADQIFDAGHPSPGGGTAPLPGGGQEGGQPSPAGGKKPVPTMGTLWGN